VCTNADTVTDEDSNGIGDGTSCPMYAGHRCLEAAAVPQREESHLKFYPIYVDVKQKKIVGCGEPLPLGQHPKADKKVSDVRTCWPERQDGAKALAAERGLVQELARERHIKIGSIQSEKITFYYLMEGQRKKLESGELLITGQDEYGGIVVGYASADSISGRPRLSGWRHRIAQQTTGHRCFASFIPGRSFPFRSLSTLLKTR